MILGVSPMVDYAFQRVFGSESTIPVLMSLIDSVLNPPPQHRLESLVILNPFNPKERFDDKKSILDVKARDQSGRQFNVEMQVLAFPSYDSRILYYAAKLHQQQMHTGDNYAKLRPTVSISFLNHVLYRDLADYHLEFGMLEKRHHVPFRSPLDVHLFELPKFTKSLAELKTELDAWLYFLRYAESMEVEALPTAIAERPPVKQAVEELKMLAQSDLEREQYEARRKWQLDHNTAMIESRQAGRQEEQFRVIHFCERLLHRPETPDEQLSRLSFEELSHLVERLEGEVLQVRGAQVPG
jgi:predicted transposase/invertase (TIGR01784 family)